MGCVIRIRLSSKFTTVTFHLRCMLILNQRAERSDVKAIRGLMTFTAVISHDISTEDGHTDNIELF